MHNIRCIIIIKSRTINLSEPKQDTCLTINLKNEVKGNIVPEVYTNNSISEIWNGIVDNTSVSFIRNGFVEVFKTKIKVALVVFDNELPNKPTPIGASKAETDLLNSTVSSYMNDSIPLQVDSI